MRVTRYEFFPGPGPHARRAGACIGLGGLEAVPSVAPAALVAWMGQLPFPFSAAAAEFEGTPQEALLALLTRLVEHSQLDPAPPTVLAATAAELLLWLPIEDDESARLALGLLGRCLLAVAAGAPPAPEDHLRASRLLARTWNQTHFHLAHACRQLGLPFHRCDYGGLQYLRIGQGANARLFRETITDRTPYFAMALHTKAPLHQVLAQRGLPLPAQRVVTTLAAALEAAAAIGWPVVLKPAASGKGKGVWVGLADGEQLRQAWLANGAEAAGVQIVQQLLHGHDHRLLVSGGTLLGVALRQPAVVVGDGQRSVGQLVEELNADPRRGIYYERLLNRVPLDGRLHDVLAEQGLALASIPAAGSPVRLSRTANISQGGTAVDRTAAVHPDNRQLALDVARLLGADVVGLDFISADIARSWREGGTWLLEANLSPGLRPHLIAEPGGDLCRRLLLQWLGDPPRVTLPTAAVAAPGAPERLAVSLEALLRHAGLRSALAAPGGQRFDGLPIATEAARTTPLRLTNLLMDARLEALVVAVPASLPPGALDQERFELLLLPEGPIPLPLLAAKVVIEAGHAASLSEELRSAQRVLIASDPPPPGWRAHRDAGGLAALHRLSAGVAACRVQRGGDLLLEVSAPLPTGADGAAGLRFSRDLAFLCAAALALGLEAGAVSAWLGNGAASRS